jgi:hypothetical protein
MLTRLLVLFILLGCASNKPTPYQKEKKKEGYQEKTFEDLNVTTFKGNSHTKREQAQLYAQFRAIEICRESEKKLANIIDVFDKTVEKNYIRSTGSGWAPSYSYFGGYPYYSRYSGIGIGVGYNTMSTNSWNEKLFYPIIEVYYTCSDQVFRPQLIFKEISADQVKHLVKDIKGAIQVERIAETSPNKNAVELGDIILKANGKRIEKVYELISLFNKDSREISVLLLREGEKVVSKIKSTDITAEVKKTESEIIRTTCRKKTKKYEKQLKKINICH